jgi:hypothetical protein
MTLITRTGVVSGVAGASILGSVDRAG